MSKVKDSDVCSIDVQEWKDLLLSVEEEGSIKNGKTKTELQALWGLTKYKTGVRIQQLLDNGGIEKGWKLIRDTMDRDQNVTAYRIIKK